MSLVNTCAECEKFRVMLIEKDKEIEKLKLHIQNLAKYLLCKENNIKNKSDFLNSKFTIASVEDILTEQSFYSSELFFKSAEILNKNVLKSKSTQTDNCENLSSFDESTCCTKNIEDHQIENQSDYVYDENYQMYYSLSTGYYYDGKSGLMYEPQSRTYYKYDYNKKEYEKVPQQTENNTNVHENETAHPQIESNGDVHEDEKTDNYICQSMVDQVSNLNLDDETAKSEKFEIEEENKNASEGKHNVIDDATVNATSSENDAISLGYSKDWQPEEGSKLTVTDMVKQVVEEHHNMSDYIYDESYRMYYSPSTGYFYDDVRNLLYDPNSGIYYFYDSSTQKYQFYCQTSPSTVENNQLTTTKNNVDKDRVASRRKYWRKKLELSKQSPKSPKSDDDNNDLIDFDEEFSDPEEGEIFSSDEDSNTPTSIVRPPVKSPCSKITSTEESFPPSIRAIVENSENLQIGSLILITCSGGIIGRDKTNAVYLPDICVSKIHANIIFNSDFQTYSIEDLGSQNGTFINDKRLSEPKLKSEPHTLNHGDKLSLGSCKLLLHIHEGHDTCDYCEPGQVLAEIASNIEKTPVIVSKEEKEKIRREELRRMKKKYGLQGADFEQKRACNTSQGYEDKAEVRRRTVGSDNPYEKTEEASVNVSMPETNKGYQMLKKMGWKEGQTLGTSDSGLVEPIPLCPWIGTAGLGSSDQSSSRPQSQDKKAMKWVKAQERYFQLSLPRDPS